MNANRCPLALTRIKFATMLSLPMQKLSVRHWDALNWSLFSLRPQDNAKLNSFSAPYFSAQQPEANYETISSHPPINKDKSLDLQMASVSTALTAQWRMIKLQVTWNHSVFCMIATSRIKWAVFWNVQVERTMSPTSEQAVSCQIFCSVTKNVSSLR